MPCRSWSLEARVTCPGSIDRATKELVEACKGCYATTGFYRMKSVNAPRVHNKEDWKNSDWVDVMVDELDNDRYFRWFDSGDVYCVALAIKILAVMKATPWCKHWMPTRMHKINKVRIVLEKMKALENVMVRYSSDGIHGEHTNDHGSTIAQADIAETIDGALCEASTREGKCATCRQCWDKSIPLIVYPQHGKKMEKVNLISLIAIAA